MVKENTIRAVIWDLGGVIVRTHDRSGRARWEKQLGLKPYELSKLVFEGEMGRRASAGQATPDDVWVWVADQINLPQEKLIDLAKDFWGGDRVDEDLMAFIRKLRPKYKTALISNNWSDLRDALEQEWDIADAFDDLVISAEAGLVKPDPRIYELSLRNLGIVPGASVFIDDFVENVEGAQAVGMQAIHFKTPEQVQSDLCNLLGLSL